MMSDDERGFAGLRDALLCSAPQATRLSAHVIAQNLCHLPRGHYFLVLYNSIKSDI